MRIFILPRHVELFSASKFLIKKTLKQVQGDVLLNGRPKL